MPPDCPPLEYGEGQGQNPQPVPIAGETRQGETVEFNGRKYPHLFTASSQYLIDLFDIEDDEQRQLTTIHSKALHAERERERDLKRKRAERKGGSMDEYNHKRQSNKREIIRLLSCGIRQADIVKLVGVSRQFVSRVSMEIKKARKVSGTKG